MSEFNVQHNRAVWFDIPFDHLDRAVDFYSTVMNIKVQKESMGEIEFAVLEHGEGNGGCLVPRKEGTGSAGGILVYLNVNGRIRDAVTKTVEKGGSIIQDTHSIGPHGFRALILDSEGNHLALHSETDA